MASITIQLDPIVEARLLEIAEARQQPLAEVAADMVASSVDREVWERAQILKGLAELEAGEGVSHERVVAWLDSWGTENELPPPR